MGLLSGIMRMAGGGGVARVARATSRALDERFQQSESGGRGTPGTRVAGAMSGSGGGNGTVNPYSMSELNILSRADARVLGLKGIVPVLDDPGLERLWDEYTVNREGNLTVHEYQRIMLARLVLTGEAWVWQDDGKFDPLPAPTEIRKRDGRPYEYRWHNYAFPTGDERGVLPADVVQWYGIRWYENQSRGVGLARCLKEGDKARHDHLMATVKREVMLAVYHLALRSNSTGQEVDATTTAEQQKAADDAKTQTIDVTESRLWEMGQDDHLDVQNSGAPPVSPQEFERFIAGWMGQAYGLSRLALTGDASDSNYTSSRYANEMDDSAWDRYRWLVVRLTKPVWEAWPGSVSLPPPDWSFPPPIIIDPTKHASALKVLTEAGIVSKAWARRQLGVNPTRMQDEIDEESGDSSAAVGAPRPPAPPPQPPP